MPQAVQQPPPPAKSGGLAKSALLKVGGVVVALLIAGGVYFFQYAQAKVSAPDVGECVQVTGTSTDAEIESLDCDSMDASLKVVGDDGNCDETEINFTSVITGRGGERTAADLCLDVNAKAGDCFEQPGMDPPAKVECSKAGGATAFKVAFVSDTSSDKSQCPKKSVAVANKTRDTLICIAEVA